jgi:hypothetical protein
MYSNLVHMYIYTYVFQLNKNPFEFRRLLSEIIDTKPDEEITEHK